MTNSPHLLVVEGNPPAVRDRMSALGAPVTGDLYCQTLASCLPGVHCDIVRPTDADAELPPGAALEQYDGIAWTGSALNVYNDEPEVTRQIAFAKTVFHSRVPFFGSCWGLQIAAVAAGGEVALNAKGREIGIARKITLSAAGREHPIFDGRLAVFDSICVHQDEVTRLPVASTILASNDISEVQAAEIRHDGGVFHGVQYHPEFDLAYIAYVCRRLDEVLVGEGFFHSSDEVMNYADRLAKLSDDPARRDIAWQIGADRDVLDPDVRLLEIYNWLHRIVLPCMALR